MQYGYFDNENKEYVIMRPNTPTPWINYIANKNYVGVISNTGGGFSFCQDPRYKRILRFRFNNLPVDRPGRYIYLKNDENGKYWSATWQPVLLPVEKMKYTCRHGLGYTVIQNEYENILTTVRYFVPPDDDLEIWDLTVENKSNQIKNLTLFTYAEFCLYIVLEDLTNFQSTSFRARINYDNGIVYHTTHNTPCLYKSSDIFKYYYSYFTANISPIGFDCNREQFIGIYHDESNPLAVERGKSFNSCFGGGNPIASLSYHLTLQPNEKKRIIHLLGANEKKEDCLPVIEKYKKEEMVEAAFLKLKEEWEKNLNNFLVETPDKSFDTGFNIWNQYQCHITFKHSRSLSYLEPGHIRGIGFRDSNQDLLGFLHNEHYKKEIKNRICAFLENQWSNGCCNHQFFPMTKEAQGAGLWSDDPMWLVISVCAYLKETGDLNFLKEEVSFYDTSSASVYEHLKRAIKYTQTQLGKHQLPLIKTADWNDCLNLPAGTESVLTAYFFVYACNELSYLAKEIGENKEAEEFTQIGEKMKEIINQVAWDGQWYVRALYPDGRVLGSDKCVEGKIHLNAQTWAVISGVASYERAFICMNSAREYLNTEHGLKLFTPPYYNDYVGEATSYPPGLKENASIFCQPNQWAIIAECLLGRGNYAYEYHSKLYMGQRNDIVEIHQAEPYTYSQFLTGPDHPHFGKAGHPWMTATGAWTFNAISQYILGVKPTYKGLMIEPCIPDWWKEFKIKRVFRGTTYYLTIKNPEKILKGIKKILINGKEYKNNILPLTTQPVQDVLILMGK